MSLYAVKIDLINMELKHRTRVLEGISVWNHNGKFDGDRACVQAKFGWEGIHLSAASQYQLYKSLHKALTPMANSLSRS